MSGNNFGSGLNLQKIEAINTKRTIAFVDHFLSTTIRFMNTFCRNCETKLLDLNTRLGKLETMLSILETRLFSIPGHESALGSNNHGLAITGSAQNEVDQPKNEPAANVIVTEVAAPIQQTLQPEILVLAEIQELVPDKPPTLTVSQDPRYVKYFKMVKVGIPIMALRPKLLAEGLNPDLLETPDAPAPPQAAATADGATDSDLSESSVD